MRRFQDSDNRKMKSLFTDISMVTRFLLKSGIALLCLFALTAPEPVSAFDLKAFDLETDGVRETGARLEGVEKHLPCRGLTCSMDP